MKTGSLERQEEKNPDWQNLLRNKYLWISFGAVLLVVVGGYFAYDYFAAENVEVGHAPIPSTFGPTSW